MRKFLLFIVFLPIISFAQSKSDSLKWQRDTIQLAPLRFDSTGIISYKIVENVPGVSKTELFNRAKIWTAVAFNNSKNVTRLDDKDAGTIVIKAITKEEQEYKVLGIGYPVEYYLHFTLLMSFKENKYRVILTNFSVETIANPSRGTYSSTYTLESSYKRLQGWNENAKTGNMQYNRVSMKGPSGMRPEFGIVNTLHQFALSTLDEIKSSLSKPAKADDF